MFFITIITDHSDISSDSLISETSWLIFRGGKNPHRGGKSLQFVPDSYLILLFSWRTRRCPQNVWKMVTFIFGRGTLSTWTPLQDSAPAPHQDLGGPWTPGFRVTQPDHWAILAGPPSSYLLLTLLLFVSLPRLPFQRHWCWLDLWEIPNNSRTDTTSVNSRINTSEWKHKLIIWEVLVLLSFRTRT